MKKCSIFLLIVLLMMPLGIISAQEPETPIEEAAPPVENTEPQAETPPVEESVLSIESIEPQAETPIAEETTPPVDNLTEPVESVEALAETPDVEETTPPIEDIVVEPIESVEPQAETPIVEETTPPVDNLSAESSAEEQASEEAIDPVLDDAAAIATLEIALETAAEADITVVVDNGTEQGVLEGLEPTTAAETLEILSDPYYFDGAQYVGYTSSPIANCPPIVTLCNTSVVNPLQTAVNNAPVGATVFVEPGTYTEQVFINKNLTLQSTGGAGSTTIRAPGALAVHNTRNAVVAVENASVTIDGFTIDGDQQGAANPSFVGVHFFNATGGGLFNSLVTGITHNPLDGTQNGVGVRVDGTSNGVVIQNNTIEDFQKNGITVNGAGVTANVLDNTITGSGATSIIAQNGVQYSNGAGGIIDGNTITDVAYTGAGWLSAHILVIDGGAVQITNNTIDSHTTPANTIGGIVLYDTVANIQNNTVTNQGWGVIFEVFGATNPGGTFTGNIVTNNDIGIYTSDPDVLINGNDIYGNTTAGVVFGDYNSTGQVLDARGNYWGCTTGADTPGCDTTAIEAAVAGTDIDTSNFLTASIVPPPPPPTTPVSPVPTITIEGAGEPITDPYRCNRWHDIAVFRERNSLDLYLVNPLSKGEFYTRFSYTDLLAFELAFSSGQITNPLFTSRTSEYHPGANLNAIYLGNGNWQFIVFRPGRIAVSDVCFRLGPIRP